MKKTAKNDVWKVNMMLTTKKSKKMQSNQVLSLHQIKKTKLKTTAKTKASGDLSLDVKQKEKLIEKTPKKELLKPTDTLHPIHLIHPIQPKFSEFLPILEIPPSDSSDMFIQYLNRPLWFKRHFQLEFDKHRKSTSGKIFLLQNQAETAIIGCIYIELHPHHQSYGKYVPIFGWLQADSEKITKILLDYGKHYVQKQGFSQLRGPINEPSIYGGWGVRTEGQANRTIIYSAENEILLPSWIIKAGWEVETEYISVLTFDYGPLACPLQNFSLNSYPIQELYQKENLMAKIRVLIQESFVSRLPDTSGDQKTQKILALLDNIKNGEDFYLIAQDNNTQEVIAVILLIPNIFDSWQGQDYSSCINDTALINKKYQNAGVFLWLNYQLYVRLCKRGVNYNVGALIWSKNTPALKCFAHGSDPIAKFKVFHQKF